MTEETFKGGIHAVAVTLLSAMTAYNIMRWCAGRETRNLINGAMYGSALAYEWAQVHRHWRAR